MTIEHLKNDSTALSRYKLLQRAADTVTTRGTNYGTPESNFERIAVLWTCILGVEIKSTQVAQMMVALKLARLCEDDSHIDSWVDIAGYAACGFEIVEGRDD
jgi:hypothetical protein